MRIKINGSFWPTISKPQVLYGGSVAIPIVQSRFLPSLNRKIDRLIHESSLRDEQKNRFKDIRGFRCVESR